MQGGRRRQRPQEVVGHDRAVMSLADGGDFFAVRDAARQGHIRPQILGAALLQQLAKLPYRHEALAVAKGHRGFLRDVGLGGDAVDLDRVFEEEDVEGLEGLGEGEGDHGRQLAVQLDNQVQIRAAGFAGGRGQIDRGLDHPRLALVVAVRGDGVELDGGEALGDRGLGGVEVGLRRGPARQQVQADFVADVAAQ